MHDRTFYEEKFFNWLKTHEVKPESGMHFVQMLRNFADNEDFINHHNSLDKTYKLGHNKFSHLNEAEWKEHVRLIKMDENRVSTTTLKHSAPANTASVPASVDWRTQGAVTPVKDQGQCGSCWSFSTTGSLEGAYQIKNGNLKSFSEQELVDCDTFKNKANRGTDMGCNGGIYDKAFDWTAKNGGLCTEADYPYTSGT